MTVWDGERLQGEPPDSERVDEISREIQPFLHGLHPGEQGAILADLLAIWLKENPGARIRLLGVGTSHLNESDQLDLFNTPKPQTATPQTTTSTLDDTLDAIRKKFGAQALTRAGNLDDH